jgi:hypothetical protein
MSEEIACLKKSFACRNYACLKEFFFMPPKKFACLKKIACLKKFLHAEKKVLHALNFILQAQKQLCMPKNV